MIHGAARRVGAALVDREIVTIGPDVLAEEFDAQRFLHRLREDDPRRGVGDALLDQRSVAGFGNVWKSEGCFLARVDPWRALSEVSDEELMAVVEESRPLMILSARRGGRIVTVDPHGRRGAGRQAPGVRRAPAVRPVTDRSSGTTRYWVYDRAALPCRRCGTSVRARDQGEAARTTFWCPCCQS